MTNKTKVVSIVLFLSAFIMLVSYGNQKVEWKGNIEKENGVTIIKNPRESLYGEIEFELEEDLSIGYYLYRVKMSFYPLIIKNGYIYRTSRDRDTGYLKIKRYKIKNWDQIREGI